MPPIRGGLTHGARRGPAVFPSHEGKREEHGFNDSVLSPQMQYTVLSIALALDLVVLDGGTVTASAVVKKAVE